MSAVPDTRLEGIERGEGQAAAVRALVEADPPPMISCSIEAFRRDLPRLLRSHRGRWVAYHGERCLGFGRRETPLYQKCLRDGLSREEFIVAWVDPAAFDPDEDLDAPLAV